MMKKQIMVWPVEGATRKEFLFTDTTVRLNDDIPSDPYLALRQVDGEFPVGGEHSVRTRIMSPKAVKKWLKFEAEEEKPDGTDIGYRLVVLNGTKELFWNGAAWAAAGAGEWNTLAQVCTNIASYELEDYDLAIKVNLTTTDAAATPKVRRFKVVAEIAVEWNDDLVYDTLVRRLKADLRPTTIIRIAVNETTSTIDLSTDYKTENSGYNFTGAKAVYNLTSDPKKLKNILASYTQGPPSKDGDPTPGQVNLTAPANADEILELYLEYVPEVAVQTSMDFYEVARYPALVFEGVTAVKLGDKMNQELKNTGTGSEVVRDFVMNTGFRQQPPKQTAFRIDFMLYCNTVGELVRMQDGVQAWTARNQLLRTWGCDELITLDPLAELETDKGESPEDVVTLKGSWTLRGVPLYMFEATEVPLVQQLNTTTTTT